MDLFGLRYRIRKFGAYEIGGCFAFMSIVSVAASQPLAYFADKIGKIPSILTGCSLFATSIFCMPFATNLSQLITLLLPFSLGSTIMQTTPTTLMSDLSSNEQRSQALSLLRTVGDIGLFSGAICSGLLAHSTSIETSIVMNGSI
jgi:MFS family permease